MTIYHPKSSKMRVKRRRPRGHCPQLGIDPPADVDGSALEDSATEKAPPPENLDKSLRMNDTTTLLDAESTTLLR